MTCLHIKKRQAELYNSHSWLCGCPETKAFYCFPCLLFPVESRMTSWNSSGFTSLSNMASSRKKHMNNKDHLAAATAFSLLGKSAARLRINEKMSALESRNRSHHNAEVKRNRDFLEHHVRATVLLATQGLAFRSKDESKGSHNRGNYLKLLENFQHYSGNKLLSECLFGDTRPSFSGLSGNIQNELIECLFDEVLESVKMEVKQSKYVSLIAEEFTNTEDTPQLALCLRYTNNGIVKERLVDVADVYDYESASHDAVSESEALELFSSKHKSAIELSSGIKASLMSRGIVRREDRVVGQSCNSAGIMAGTQNSVQKHLQEIWPDAKFVHCYAHRLHDIVQKACENVRAASDFFQVMSALCKFFRSSPQRGCLLHKKVPAVGYIKWLTSGKCVKYVYSHRKEILEVLHELIFKATDSTTRYEATAIYTALKTDQTLFLLCVFNDILEKAHGLSQTLPLTDKIDIKSQK